jgi:hypothetical protein
VDEVVWRTVAQADAGWRQVTVDAFASPLNSRAPSIRSRFDLMIKSDTLCFCFLFLFHFIIIFSSFSSVSNNLK